MRWVGRVRQQATHRLFGGVHVTDREPLGNAWVVDHGPERGQVGRCDARAVGQGLDEYQPERLPPVLGAMRAVAAPSVAARPA